MTTMTHPINGMNENTMPGITAIFCASLHRLIKTTPATKTTVGTKATGPLVNNPKATQVQNRTRQRFRRGSVTHRYAAAIDPHQYKASGPSVSVKRVSSAECMTAITPVASIAARQPTTRQANASKLTNRSDPAIAEGTRTANSVTPRARMQSASDHAVSGGFSMCT